MTKHIVKSFNLDHTKVTAPFIRLADEIISPKGDIIVKLDLRFTQPNKEFMDMPAMHTMEHLLATYLRDGGKYKIIDFSPMGCQTGFYLTLFGPVDLAEFKDYFKACLKLVAEAQTIPGTQEKECGNYKSHSLANAKKFALNFLNADAEILK
ncbi:MAG: S-ribosylhomocysteine lyase [Elusimicrobiota bacterium]|jgi:S-ribosylhomocysteine lyase|nr:S-ribosylhomocysteine lyase [Elusimicrobiota bacterium]